MHGRRFIIMCWPRLFPLAIFLFLAGCGANRPPVPEKITLPSAEKIAIVGFRAALDEGDRPRTVRDPLSGTLFWAEPVSPAIVRTMTGELFNRLESRGDRELMPPGEALGAYASLASGNMQLALMPMKMLQEIGKKLGADLVLVGYLYRWRERHGADYAVNSPASVAFDLHLVRSRDGKIIWTGKFDKTQRPLSANILDLKTFLGGKGRWMTAKELASLGLDRLLAEMPK